MRARLRLLYEEGRATGWVKVLWPFLVVLSLLHGPAVLQVGYKEAHEGHKLSTREDHTPPIVPRPYLSPSRIDRGIYDLL